MNKLLYSFSLFLLLNFCNQYQLSFSKQGDKNKPTANNYKKTNLNLSQISEKITQSSNQKNQTQTTFDAKELHGNSTIKETLRKSNQKEFLTFDEKLKPFYHGVASGDPLSDRVILWTRVTHDFEGDVSVSWDVATDKFMKNIIKTGNITTNQDKDYTIKIDVDGLNSATTYYYQFTDNLTGKKSIIGRTRTSPTENDENTINHLRFAMVSCVNYQWGYFNALERIAEREDLDAVIHLGDYFYEYSDNYYTHPKLNSRKHQPSKETVELADYRLRFSQYRLDPMLRKVHQQHPMIATWDDHESANDSWIGGAQNHNTATEGNWEDRVQSSVNAYNEWMPIRTTENKKNIYRSFNYGNLVEIIMLETRLSGREEPMGTKGGANNEVDTLKWQDPNRTMLGQTQFNWLANLLLTSKAKWKFIASSIMMVPIPPQLITNMDSWDGYPAEREKLCQLIKENNIKNVGILSGDFHMSFASNVLSVLPQNLANYNPVTADGTAAFEFTTPSVSSANLNEQDSLTLPGIGVIKPLAMELPERSQVALLLENQVVTSVPWIKYMNSDQHGYVVLDVTPNKTQADWFLMEDILNINDKENFSKAFFVDENSNKLNESTTLSSNKTTYPELAPWDLELSIKQANDLNNSIIVFGNYPNPVIDYTLISFATNNNGKVRINLYDMQGNLVQTIFDGFKELGVHGIPFETSKLIPGNYFYNVIHNNEVVTKKLIKVK